MKLLRAFLYLASVAVLSFPLIIIICQGEESKQSLKSAMTSEAVDDSVCRDGSLDGCLKARDDSLRNKEYVQAFSYMRRLCEDFKNSDACLRNSV